MKHIVIHYDEPPKNKDNVKNTITKNGRIPLIEMMERERSEYERIARFIDLAIVGGIGFFCGSIILFSVIGLIRQLIFQERYGKN